MKKIVSILISLLLLFPFFLIVETNSASASCYHSYSVTSNDIVEPHCSSGKLGPVGWSSVRSGAKYDRSTKGGTKIYIKSGGAAQASSDFNIVAPNVQYRKYINSDGSVTLVKLTPQGDVKLYKSSSGKEPTISWDEKEKIRYKN